MPILATTPEMMEPMNSPVPVALRAPAMALEPTIRNRMRRGRAFPASAGFSTLQNTISRAPMSVISQLSKPSLLENISARASPKKMRMAAYSWKVESSDFPSFFSSSAWVLTGGSSGIPLMEKMPK